MRLFIVYILGIHILALSIMPCGDAYNECQNNSATKEVVQSHNHKSDHNDICSPFCTCTCCSSTANLKFVSFNITSIKLISASAIKFPIQDFSFISNYYGNIWQPPKINV